MKKIALIGLILLIAFGNAPVFAQEADVTPAPAEIAAVEPEVAPAEAAPEEAAPAEEAVAEEAPAPENLEFVSGEVTALDESSKNLSVKLYGENENNTPEKTIAVQIDENTDITDGEKDRDFKSLAVGTEVDVEYDPTSNKATYIFVY